MKPIPGESGRLLPPAKKAEIQRAFDGGLTGWRLEEDQEEVKKLAGKLELTQRQVEVKLYFTILKGCNL